MFGVHEQTLSATIKPILGNVIRISRTKNDKKSQDQAPGLSCCCDWDWIGNPGIPTAA
jgi:hypothetical protein